MLTTGNKMASLKMKHIASSIARQNFRFTDFRFQVFKPVEHKRRFEEFGQPYSG